MRIAVLFDTAYGNTELIARSMVDALRSDHEVDLVRVDLSTPLPDGDLVLVGAPTQMHRVSAAMSRFLDRLPDVRGVRVAAFDTRLDRARILTGSASGLIARRLRGRGARLVAAPESFIVADREGPLVDGEIERAAAWARSTAAKVR